MNKEIETKKKYKDRELDWLKFNARVLQEAEDESNPLYERLRFLAIFSSNLDEFFKVRVSKLRQLKKVEKAIRRPLALKPNKTLKSILKEVDAQQERFGKIFKESLLPELSNKGVHLTEIDSYDSHHIKYLEDYFAQEIQPHVQLIAASLEGIRKIKDGQTYICVEFSGSDKLVFLSTSIPGIPRFVEVPHPDEGHHIVFLEDIIKLNVPKLFDGGSVVALYTIKVSRDAELYLEDDYRGAWIKNVYQALEERQKGQPTRLLYEGGMPKRVRHLVAEQLGLGEADMVKGGSHHNFSDFMDFPNPAGNESLYYKPMPPLASKSFDRESDYFKLIREKDRILHFPYQKFGYVENLVHQAAMDPNVSTIHISLYRIAKDSALTDGLLKAIDHGKKVTIFVEAKARFDEKNNLDWGKTFEEKGASVHYSFPNVKVHSKILLIGRHEHGSIRNYGYIGTGNFNAKTSLIYCDHGIFTADPDITNDLEQVFLVLQRKVLVPKLSNLLVSPYNSRLIFERLIQNEIEFAAMGRKAGITIKMNSLEDRYMIDWLYRASRAGVKVKLLVRGFCCLVPGVEGLSENIQVISILDRFLEHGRVYLFENGGDPQMYIGSADWMKRNLDSRIEVIMPVLDETVFEELQTILMLQMSDNVKARHIVPGHENPYVRRGEGEEPIRSQYAIYRYLDKKN
nr:polyphosphate kinase 1 [uncultured Allomuricauda sp.]